jgi:hypothetical protein
MIKINKKFFFIYIAYIKKYLLFIIVLYLFKKLKRLIILFNIISVVLNCFITYLLSFYFFLFL